MVATPVPIPTHSSIFDGRVSMRFPSEREAQIAYDDWQVVCQPHLFVFDKGWNGLIIPLYAFEGG